MKKQFLLLLGFLLVIPFVYAEEFEQQYEDGDKYTLNYKINNGTVLDFKSFSEHGSFLFDVTGNNGDLVVTIPKTIPIYPNTINDYVMFVLVNGEQVFPKELERSCDFEITVNFDGKSEIEFVTSVSLVESTFTYFELPERCLDDPKYNTEIQQKLKAKDCTDNNFKKGFNIRDEVVCISEESYSYLYMRDYLKTSPILPP